MKKIIVVTVFVLMMFYLPPKYFAFVYILFLFGTIIRTLVIYVIEEKSEHPWLALSNYPEIIPVDEVEGSDERTNYVERTAFNALERAIIFINLSWQFVSLALLIYISMKAIRNPMNQMMALAYSSLLMLPLANAYYQRLVNHREMENPFGIKGVYVGYIEGEITPTSLFFKRPSKTTFECHFAQVLINGKTHNVLCDKEILDELVINEGVYVYSRIGNSEEILGVGGIEDTPIEQELEKDER